MHIKEYQDKNGHVRYMFQGYLGIDESSGEMKRVCRRGLNSKKECEDLFYKLKYEFERGNYKVSNKKYTFSEVYDLWYEEYKNTVKESTLQATKRMFELHILPQYKGKYIDRITIADCQKAVNDYSKRVKKYKIFNNYTGLVFHYAMKNRFVSEDPTKLVTLPQLPDEVEDLEEDNFYSKEELKLFLQAAKTEIKWYTLFRLLAFSGMRKGEILALSWDDVDFNNSSLSVGKTVTRGLENKVFIGTPKTKKSKRIISLDSETVEILKTWRTTQASEMLQIGINTLANDEQLIFSNSVNELICTQKVGQKIESICRKCNLKYISPHGFRHTHCSLLFEAGATIKEVQDRLGHADIHTTMNVYAHVSKNKKNEVADKFANFMK